MSDFQWPEPTNEQLIELLARTRNIDPTYRLRAAIHLDRRLLAGVDSKIVRAAWHGSSNWSSMGVCEWIFTRGGTVEPLFTAAPTLAEALEASKELAGESAGVVIRYLQAQQQEGQE